LYGKRKGESYTEFDAYFERKPGATLEQDEYCACAIMYMVERKKKSNDLFVRGVDDYKEYDILHCGFAFGSFYYALQQLWNRLAPQQYSDKLHDHLRKCKVSLSTKHGAFADL
jgi:hypothetical protein